MASHVHKGSEPVSYYGDELTHMPHTLIDVEQSSFHAVPPTSSVADSEHTPTEYFRRGTPDHYLDLGNSHIHIQGSVVNIDGSKVSEDENVTPVNDFGNTVYSSNDVYLNEQLVSKDNGMVCFRAYISTTTGCGSDAKGTYLQRQVYYPDTAGEGFDEYVISPSRNSALVSRNHLSKGSKIIDMVFKPHIDLFNQNRPIPPNVDLRLRMTRSSAAFCLMASGEKEYKVKITHAMLYVKVLKMNDSVIQKHREVLSRNGVHVFPIPRVSIRTFTIGAGTMSCVRPNIINGQIPNKIIMGIITNKAYVGDYRRSPYRFRPYDMKKVNIVVNGRTIPSRPYSTNFNKDDGYQFMRCFQALNEIMGPSYRINGNGITRDMYADGYTLIPFSISDHHNENTFGLYREGDVQLEIEFGTSTPEVLNVILYMEFENTITIDKNGDVKTDF